MEAVEELHQAQLKQAAVPVVDAQDRPLLVEHAKLSAATVQNTKVGLVLHLRSYLKAVAVEQDITVEKTE